jgi:hypothetical protein
LTFPVRIVIAPLEGIASRALIARFKMTNSIWLGSTRTRESGSARAVSILLPAPTALWSSPAIPLMSRL